MNIVNIRSPFKIVINESGQLFTQVKLYIWNKGDTEPTTPTYTLSKNVPDLVNRECVFNISNFLQEFVEPIEADASFGFDIVEENHKNWCFFKVERYYGVDIKDLTLLDTTNYIGLNGFTDYMLGNQEIELANYKFLIPVNEVDYLTNKLGYINLIIDTNYTNYEILFLDGIYDYVKNLIDLFGYGVFLFKIPFAYSLNNTCSIVLYDITNDESLIAINTNPIDECKYTPVECAFINSRGGWQFLTFFKAQLNSISVKGSEFNLLPDATNYEPLRGQTKVFNLNGNQTIKCNTGWIDENKNLLFRDLLLSETVLIDNKPAKLKTQSLTYKTQLKDKMINYEMEFEYAFDLINNVV
jgi:hypothetical protein